MEFVLFLFFLILHLLGMACLSYLSRLLFFEKKDEYYREEILSLGRAIPVEILRIWESSGNTLLSAALFFISALCMYLWSMLGGMIGSPHYSHAWGNYFFHFPIFFYIFIFSFPFLKSAISQNNNQDFYFILTENGQSIASGLLAGSLAKILTSYGAHHEMYFVYYFLNALLGFFLSTYVWNGVQFLGFSFPGEGKNSNEWDSDPESFNSHSQNWDEEDDLKSPQTSRWDEDEISSSNFDSDPEEFAPKKDLTSEKNSLSKIQETLPEENFDLDWDDFPEKHD